MYRMMKGLPGLIVVLSLAACSGSVADIDEDAFVPGAGVSDNATATLIVGDETFVWDKNEWTDCSTNGIFPASATFQEGETSRSGNWVQFIDRGDGGINFSAILNGQELSGTGLGEGADEISGNSFSYTGEMNRDGENVDVQLNVTC